MHFPRSWVQRNVLRTFFRQNSSISRIAPYVKVVSTAEDDSVKVSFRFSNSNHLSLKAPKTESIRAVLTRIKLMAEIQRKKEQIMQSVFSKYSSSSTQVAVEQEEEYLKVCLIQDDSVLDANIPNHEAWCQASFLKIGDTVYDIKYNFPAVTSLSLAECILSGCSIRPHVVFELANANDSDFTWYRSLNKNHASELINSGKTDEVLIENENFWLKIHEGFIYNTTIDDIGHFLKVVCIPKQSDLTGTESSVTSKAVVEAAPEMFPFEERQLHTKSFCDDHSIRCVSYNVLANVYVEKRKFPYTTQKARDIYYRKQLLLKELQGYKSDILCLQEIQERMFELDLVPVLKQSGYVGFYTRKGGHRSEGLATFFRSTKFKVLRKYGILLNRTIKDKNIYLDLLTRVAGNYKDMSKLLAQDTALQVLLLEHINQPDKKILIANTHLYSNKDSPEVRLIQTAVCTYYIDHVVKRKDLQTVPVLFCGDFNSLPDSATYDFMTSGYYECCPSWKNNSDTDIDTVLRHNLCLDSACGIPEYTNYTEEFQGCLDYIFYSKNSLKVTEVVPMPRHELVTANVALPSEYFSSDHIALVCTLQWINS